MFHIIFSDILGSKGTKHNSSELLLHILDFGKQLEPLKFLPGTLLAVTMLEINHEERNGLLWFLYCLPFSLRLLFSFLLLLVDLESLEILLKLLLFFVHYDLL